MKHFSLVLFFLFFIISFCFPLYCESKENGNNLIASFIIGDWDMDSEDITILLKEKKFNVNVSLLDNEAIIATIPNDPEFHEIFIYRFESETLKSVSQISTIPVETDLQLFQTIQQKDMALESFLYNPDLFINKDIYSSVDQTTNKIFSDGMRVVSCNYMWIDNFKMTAVIVYYRPESDAGYRMLQYAIQSGYNKR